MTNGSDLGKGTQIPEDSNKDRLPDCDWRLPVTHQLLGAPSQPGHSGTEKMGPRVVSPRALDRPGASFSYYCFPRAEGEEAF